MIKEKLTALNMAIEREDEETVQDIIFSFYDERDSAGVIPDEAAFAIIDILRQDKMKNSSLSGHILNYFEFHQDKISDKAKDRCVGFLNAWGDSFTNVHSMQVVAELKHGNYIQIS